MRDIHLEDRVVGVKRLLVVLALLGAITLGYGALAPTEVPIWASCPTQSPDFEVSPTPGDACGYFGKHRVGSCVVYELHIRRILRS